MIVKPKSDVDVQSKVKACLDVKNENSPSGVLLDGRSRIHVEDGQYHESDEDFGFTRTKEILGSGFFADIIVVKDNKTKQDHALKTIMISAFCKKEIQCWVDNIPDMERTRHIPALYLFQFKEGKVEIHMEILREAHTMHYIIDKHLGKLDKSLLKPFSLYVLDGALEAASTLHRNNWVHNDLHVGNMMLQKSEDKILQLRIIDFGQASKYEDPDTRFDSSGFRSDIGNILGMFCSIYSKSKIDFDSPNWADEIRYQLPEMSEADQNEVLDLVDSANKVVYPGDVGDYLLKVKEKLNRVGNMMLQKSEDKILQLRIIDFGQASKYEDPDTRFDSSGFRSDIGNILGMFCSIYSKSKIDFDSPNWADEIRYQLPEMSEADQNEVLDLVDSANKVVYPGDVGDYLLKVKEKLNRVGNMMLQKSEDKILQLRIIDFGQASKYEDPDTRFDSSGFRSDIGNILGMFCSIYSKSKIDFDSPNWADEIRYQLPEMSEADQNEVLDLVDSANKVVYPGDVGDYLLKVKEKLNRVGNMMLQKSEDKILQLRIIDFGQASKYEDPDTRFDSSGFRSDIGNILGMFCSIYSKSKIDFDSPNWADEIRYQLPEMSEADQNEVLDLVDSANKVVYPGDVGDYLLKVKEKLNRALKEINKTKEEFLKEVEIWFSKIKHDDHMAQRQPEYVNKKSGPTVLSGEMLN